MGRKPVPVSVTTGHQNNSFQENARVVPLGAGQQMKRMSEKMKSFFV